MKTLFILSILALVGCNRATAIRTPTLADHMRFTERFEGRQSTPYVDADGHSIGVGHFIPKGQPVPAFWNDAQIETAFAADMSGAIENAKKIFSNYDALPYDAKLVVCDLSFNLGPTRLRRFKKAIAACEAFDFKTMAAELRNSKWYTQTGNRAKHHVALIAGL